MSQQIGTDAAQPYVYAGTSHRLITVAGTDRSYDANNTTHSSAGLRFDYDARNRMRAVWRNGVVQSQYDYNAKGERVRKYQGILDQARYLYTESGQLLKGAVDRGPLCLRGSLLLQERLGLDTGLLEDGAQCSFGHIAGVVWNRRVAIHCRVEPDFVTARGLPVKLQPQFLQALDDLAVAEARQPAHPWVSAQVATISG